MIDYRERLLRESHARLVKDIVERSLKHNATADDVNEAKRVAIRFKKRHNCDWKDFVNNRGVAL